MAQICSEYTGITMFICIFTAFSSLLMYQHAITINSVVIQNEFKVVIAVLSARDNFEARTSIRETWKKLTVDSDISLHFLIGKIYCNLPIPDRISPLSCHELLTHFPLVATDISSHIFDKPSNKLFYAGFTFVVHSPIIITRFILLSSIANSFHPVTVYLIDSGNQNIITSKQFSSNENNTTFILDTPDQYILPKDFEAQIVIETTEKLTHYFNCTKTWNTGNGVISFLQLIPHFKEKPVPFNANSCTPVSIAFDIHDPAIVNESLFSKDSRQKIWNSKTKLIQQKLLEESSHMKDIIFLDVLDVYKNLPKKLLLYFQWIVQENKFNYLIKSDDDTFLNVIKITEELNRIEHSADSSHLLWWGLFRENWAVSVAGKWREDLYRSLTYPPFPCGSAYVLSYDIVKYLAANAGVLQTEFQGEDVSVGIWLAGLNTVRHRTEHASWTCNQTCDANSGNRAQLSVAEMYKTWDVYNKCGKLCQCTGD